MYPNPQDVLPLPPHPDLQHYRKRAKDLAKACRSEDAQAIRAWASQWVRDLIAYQPEVPGGRSEKEFQRQIDQVAAFARDRLARADCGLSQAQFVIARAHGFLSWPKLAQHLDAMKQQRSSVSDFERAADAIVSGNLHELERLLAADPGLVHARSTREHQATLLHHVSANGIENYRQVTPANIHDIAGLLLDAGAEVDAGANVYGGNATTLALVVTSAHPRQAGVQNELADLLISHGARIPAGIVRDCLANGCPEAALHMTRRGALLTLEEAAGLGDLDAVARFFVGTEGRVPKESTAALMMACWYDRRDVIAFLLDSGVEIGARAQGEGHTALHIAAYQGNRPLVELLLRRGAPVNVADDTYGTPPLVWALHAWLVENRDAEKYRTVLMLLADAGALVEAEWIDDERVRADAQLFAALSRLT